MFKTHDTALLVIDLQAGMFDGRAVPAMPGGPALLGRIRQILDKARAAGAPVIFVRHGGGAGHLLEPGSPGWPIAAELGRRDDEPVIDKAFPDSFRETGLQAALEARGIRTLVICGAQSEYCIDTTVRRASSLGYEIVLVQDGHGSWGNDVVAADQVIAHENKTLGAAFARLAAADEIAWSR